MVKVATNLIPNMMFEVNLYEKEIEGGSEFYFGQEPTGPVEGASILATMADVILALEDVYGDGVHMRIPVAGLEDATKVLINLIGELVA